MKLNPVCDSEAITPADIAIVQDSFWALAQKGEAVGAQFYRRLFAYDSSLETISGDPSFRDQDFIKGLGRLVQHLDCRESLAEELGRFADRNANWVLNNYHHFFFGAALFGTLQQSLGRKFTAETYAAWHKVFEMALTHVRLVATHSVARTHRSSGSRGLSAA